jgi:hypothetical protein
VILADELTESSGSGEHFSWQSFQWKEKGFQCFLPPFAAATSPVLFCSTFLCRFVQTAATVVTAGCMDGTVELLRKTVKSEGKVLLS